MATRMIPPHEIAEVAAWMTGALALIGIAIWAVVGRRAAKREGSFADEQTRIDDQAAAERLAAWKAVRRG